MPSLELLAEVCADNALPMDAQGGGGVDGLAVGALKEGGVSLRVAGGSSRVPFDRVGRTQMVRDGALAVPP